MNITIALDLPTIIANSVSAERIQPIVDKAISDAIKDVINDATGYRSPFREEAKKQLTEAMTKGLSIAQVAKFQHVLNSALTSAVEGENAATINAALAKAAKAAMPDVPERVKLSALLKEARQGFHKEQHEAFYAFYEPSEYASGGGWLFLDDDERPGSSGSYRSYEDARDRRYSAKTRLAFNKEGEVYALRLDGVDVMPNKAPEAVGHFKGLLLSMYVGRTTIEIDMDADDVEYAAQAQWD